LEIDDHSVAPNGTAQAKAPGSAEKTGLMAR
jgi:hypothetical protein